MTVAKTGTAAGGGAMPLDGIAALAYDNATNRITTSGYQYDVNGNMIRSLADDGTTWVKYEYDAANRLNIIRKDDTGQTQLERFQYDSTNARVQSHDFALDRYKTHLNAGGTALAEFTEFTVAVPVWTKSYTYMGDSQLATITPVSGSENVEYNHPDRLGVKTVTNGGTSSEQAHLPFGTALNAETSPPLTTNNKRFTSYDRSPKTGLDYAVNRTYDSKLGRFSQVDPIGMQAVSLAAPQTLNMYSYCGNDPVNYTDPSGLFFGKLFRWIGKHLKKIFTAIAIALAVVAVVTFPWAAPLTLKTVLGLVASLTSAASSVFDLAGLKTLSKVFGIIAMATGIAALGVGVKDTWQRLKNLRSKIFSFVDDPPSIGEFFVEVRGFWDKVVSAVSSVSNQISAALGLSNLTLPFEAKSGAGGKNPYGPCDSFSGTNARYMYRNGGEGTWGREVRGMLLAEYSSVQGASPLGAHVRSYIRASVRNPASAPAGISKAVFEAGKSMATQAGARVAEGVNNAMKLGYSSGNNADFTCRFDVN